MICEGCFCPFPRIILWSKETCACTVSCQGLLSSHQAILMIGTVYSLLSTCRPISIKSLVEPPTSCGWIFPHPCADPNSCNAQPGLELNIQSSSKPSRQVTLAEQKCVCNLDSLICLCSDTNASLLFTKLMQQNPWSCHWFILGL